MYATAIKKFEKLNLFLLTLLYHLPPLPSPSLPSLPSFLFHGKYARRKPGLGLSKHRTQCSCTGGIAMKPALPAPFQSISSQNILLIRKGRKVTLCWRNKADTILTK